MQNMLNQSLYYTVRYFKPNTKSRGVVTTPSSLVADDAKNLGSLKANLSMQTIYDPRFMFTLNEFQSKNNDVDT